MTTATATATVILRYLRAGNGLHVGAAFPFQCQTQDSRQHTEVLDEILHLSYVNNIHATPMMRELYTQGPTIPPETCPQLSAMVRYAGDLQDHI